MRTYQRICLMDYTIVDEENGRTLTLKRGQEYLTTPERLGGTVTVFATFWASGVPISLFAGEVLFTEGK